MSIGPDDTLATALARMKLYDFQQLPVLEGDRVVGIVDESDILMAVYGHDDQFRAPVRQAMSARIETLQVGRASMRCYRSSRRAMWPSSWTETNFSA